jgi:hypothetical protein
MVQTAIKRMRRLRKSTPRKPSAEEFPEKLIVCKPRYFARRQRFANYRKISVYEILRLAVIPLAKDSWAGPAFWPPGKKERVYSHVISAYLGSHSIFGVAEDPSKRLSENPPARE